MFVQKVEKTLCDKKGLEIKGGCDKIVVLKVYIGTFVQCSGTYVP